MKTEALKVKPLGEEKPTVINDPDTKIKTRDTKIVDAPLPDSETIVASWCPCMCAVVWLIAAHLHTHPYRDFRPYPVQAWWEKAGPLMTSFVVC